MDSSFLQLFPNPVWIFKKHDGATSGDRWACIGSNVPTSIACHKSAQQLDEIHVLDWRDEHGCQAGDLLRGEAQWGVLYTSLNEQGYSACAHLAADPVTGQPLLVVAAFPQPAAPWALRAASRAAVARLNARGESRISEPQANRFDWLLQCALSAVADATKLHATVEEARRFGDCTCGSPLVREALQASQDSVQTLREACNMLTRLGRASEDMVDNRSHGLCQFMETSYCLSSVSSATMDGQYLDMLPTRPAQTATRNSEAATLHSELRSAKAAYQQALREASERKAQYDMHLAAAQASMRETVLKAQHDMAAAEAAIDTLRTKLDASVAAAVEQRATLNTRLAEALAETAAMKAECQKRTMDQTAMQDDAVRLQQENDMLRVKVKLASQGCKAGVAVKGGGSHADRLTTTLSDLLDGMVPAVQDVAFAQAKVMHAQSTGQQLAYGRQQTAGSDLDEVEVGSMLMKQLTAATPCSLLSDVEDGGLATRVGPSRVPTPAPPGTPACCEVTFREEDTAAFLNPDDALAALLAPAFDYEADDDRSSAASRSSHGNCMYARALSHALSHPIVRQSSRLSGVSQHHALSGATLIAVPAPAPLDEVMVLLGASNDWAFDALRLAEVTGGHALSALGYYKIHAAGLIAGLGLRTDRLARFLRRVEAGYLANPYHNATHAADVLQTMATLVTRCGLVPGYADPVAHLACLLAAIVHDYGHVGMTNDWLISSADDLAVLYNDRSPLENHHVAASFALLRSERYDFMADLSKADKDRLRKLVIDLVLSTDMKQHFNVVSHFSTMHGLTPADTATPPQGSDIACSSNKEAACGDVRVRTPLDDSERLLTLQMALKCADLGHTAAELSVHLKWVSALEEELFLQGDAEAAAGLPVSPLFDRSKHGIKTSQAGFFEIVVIPLFSSFSRVFEPVEAGLLSQVLRNYNHWLGHTVASSS